MTQARPTRRVLKWAGTVACVLTIGLWFLSGVYGWALRRAKSAASIWSGCIAIQWNNLENNYNGVPYSRLPPRDRRPFGRVAPVDFDWLSRLRPYWSFTGWPKYFSLPLWMPLGLTGVPTAFMWWRDRRFPRGHCEQCGYDLTGNVSRRCPECGEPV